MGRLRLGEMCGNYLNYRINDTNTHFSINQLVVMELKDAIICILFYEKSLESKLDMLTAIGITSNNDEVFKVCEEIRNELCNEEGETKREDILSSKDQVQYVVDTGNEEPNEVDGGE